MKRIIILSLALISAIVASAGDKKYTLKDGSVVIGSVKPMAGDSIEISCPSGSEVRYSSSDIVKTDTKSAAKPDYPIAGQYLQTGFTAIFEFGRVIPENSSRWSATAGSRISKNIFVGGTIGFHYRPDRFEDGSFYAGVFAANFRYNLFKNNLITPTLEISPGVSASCGTNSFYLSCALGARIATNSGKHAIHVSVGMDFTKYNLDTVDEEYYWENERLIPRVYPKTLKKFDDYSPYAFLKVGFEL